MEHFRDPDDPRIVYKLSKRAKRISLRMDNSNREVIVTIPGERAMKKAKDFAQKHKDWIEVQLETLPPAQPFLPGENILFRGERYRLIHKHDRSRARIHHNIKEIHISAPDIESFSGRVRRLLIRDAREELEAASHHYADMLSKRVRKVSIRDTSSRWGSCVTRKGEGHISYSWRLIAAPPFVLDYVAAHECAHLIEANHSQAFWDIVAHIYPDFKKAEKWLKKNGAYLHAVGAKF